MEYYFGDYYVDVRHKEMQEQEFDLYRLDFKDSVMKRTILSLILNGDYLYQFGFLIEEMFDSDIDNNDVEKYVTASMEIPYNGITKEKAFISLIRMESGEVQCTIMTENYITHERKSLTTNIDILIGEIFMEMFGYVCVYCDEDLITN